MIQVLRHTEIISFDTSLYIVNAPRVGLEANHGIVNFVIMDLLPRGQATVGGLVTS